MEDVAKCLEQGTTIKSPVLLLRFIHSVGNDSKLAITREFWDGLSPSTTLHGCMPYQLHKWEDNTYESGDEDMEKFGQVKVDGSATLTNSGDGEVSVETQRYYLLLPLLLPLLKQLNGAAEW